MTVARDAAEQRSLSHFDRLLGGKGPMAIIETFDDVTLLQYVDADFGVSHFTTLGFDRVGAPSVNPTELVITARPHQEERALDLLRYAVRHSPEFSDLTFGSAMLLPHPLLEDLPVYGLMFDASPWDEELNLILSPDGQAIELAVLSLLPMTRGDTELLKEKGPDAFDAAVEATDADVYDLFRTVAI
ncbi:MAG: suppressor of fused domain protein [Nakamurella sp.]